VLELAASLQLSASTLIFEISTATRAALQSIEWSSSDRRADVPWATNPTRREPS
jgi:hypothetical protein